MKQNGFHASPNPATDYTAALERVNAWPTQEADQVVWPCQPQFLTHGQKTDRAIIFFHGYTACPDQFLQLGQQFHQRGYNVFIPRMQFHGLRDRLTPLHAKLTAEIITAQADEAVDIGQGLGEQVQVMGLSMGGIMAAWVAQNRADVARSMLISPAMAFYAIPYRLTWLVMRLTRLAPNRFRWWDPNRKGKVAYPPYGYPRNASKALAQLLRLGFIVRQQARQSRPAAQSIVVVTNAADPSVNHRAVLELAESWRQHHPAQVRLAEFSATQKLGHDLIDPHQPDARTEIVYPVLIDLMVR